MKTTSEPPLKNAERLSTASFSPEKTENQKDSLLLSSLRNQLSTKLLNSTELTSWEEPSMLKNLKERSQTTMALVLETTSHLQINSEDLRETPTSKPQLCSSEDSHTCQLLSPSRTTSSQLVRSPQPEL